MRRGLHLKITTGERGGTMKNYDLLQWQRDYNNSPHVWITYYCDGEWTGNIYESGEAAQIEVDNYKNDTMLIRRVSVQSLDLSKRRWE
jgi:hypothetical protein